MRPSYIYNGNSYAGKTVSLYWNDPVILVEWRYHTWMPNDDELNATIYIHDCFNIV